MQFDDHEIWGAPVQAQAAPEPQRIAEHVGAPAQPGRLYKSAGCEEAVDAVVALPSRRHTSVHPIAQARAASSSLTPQGAHAQPSPGQAPAGDAANAQAPIAINSRIPRHIEDPAIAEVLSAPVRRAPEVSERSVHEGFTSWFRTVRGAAPAADPHAWADPNADQRKSGVHRRSERVESAAPARSSVPQAFAPRAMQPAERQHPPMAPAADDLDSGGISARAPRSVSLPAMPSMIASSRSFAVALFAVTTIVGIIDNRLTGGLGTITGVAFLLGTIAGTWLLPNDQRWAGRVLPAYVLMASILVSGQFSSVAPGRSIIGQALLIATGLLSLAPWLAIATVAGAVLSRRRRA